jgi:hypothetical protein
MTTPFTITVVRTRKRRPRTGPSANLWKCQRKYFGNESIRWFVIKLFLLMLLVAVSTWPMIRAIEALRLL